MANLNFGMCASALVVVGDAQSRGNGRPKGRSFSFKKFEGADCTIGTDCTLGGEYLQPTDSPEE